MLYKLDEKDKKIIDILEKHSDFTTRQIAKKTLLPPTTIHNRIRRLKQEGIIKRFTVDLDYKKIDRGLVVYVLVSANLPLLKQKKKTQYDLAKELKKLYFVERVDIVAGGTDLIVIVRVKDVEEFDHVLLEKIQPIEGIDRTQSMIVLHSN
ncbi:Lrp/AsnC family transcriptional regulator [Candidatus Woesearchaeota archaeon]|nr:Lrp/AsnC family transcriptional regulator [Candidatus Woesearchaeota archaeon]